MVQKDGVGQAQLGVGLGAKAHAAGLSLWRRSADKGCMCYTHRVSGLTVYQGDKEKINEQRQAAMHLTCW